MNRNYFYKLIRGVIFPFRFVYLIYFQWRVGKKKGMNLHPPLL
jgi:hypothetical protein